MREKLDNNAVTGVDTPKRRFFYPPERCFDAIDCKTPSNVRHNLGIRKMFYIFRRASETPQVLENTGLATTLGWIRTSGLRFRNLRKFERKTRLLCSQVLYFTHFRASRFYFTSLQFAENYNVQFGKYLGIMRRRQYFRNFYSFRVDFSSDSSVST